MMKTLLIRVWCAIQVRKKFPHFGIGLRGVFDDTVERLSLGLLVLCKRRCQPVSRKVHGGQKKGGEGKT
jgi:hypothetical protein